MAKTASTETQILKALAVTVEVIGTDMTPEAMRVVVADLAKYEPEVVLSALERVRRECRGRFSLADVLERIEDGRPEPEAAWALLPKDEESSAVITVEMERSMGPALKLLAAGDRIAARMAFLEAYRRELTRARSGGDPVQWRASLGHDQGGRVSVLAAAVQDGKISENAALTQAGGACDEVRQAIEGWKAQKALTDQRGRQAIGGPGR